MDAELQWEGLPWIVLVDVLGRVGPKDLGNSFLVCKVWSSFSQVEMLWFNILCKDLSLQQPVLPLKFDTWREYSRYLRKQSLHVFTLGLDGSSAFRLEDETGNVFAARGVTEIKLTNITVWVGSNLESRHVFMCLMGCQELLMWYVDQVMDPFNIDEGTKSYLAPFKKQNAVVGFALEPCGALVLTKEGHLYDTVYWNMVDLKGCITSFERVQFVSSAPVISFAISCAGVRTAVLESGFVFVWGTVCQSLVDNIGRAAARIFGLSPASELLNLPHCASIASPCQVLPDPSTDLEADFVEVAAGKAHFLVRSKTGTVWTWGISGRPTNCVESGRTNPPFIIHTNAAKLHNGSILQDKFGHFIACKEFVCGDEFSLWTPLYNLQFEPKDPAQPNCWPWRKGRFRGLKVGNCEIGEAEDTLETQLCPGYTRYSKHGRGCIRIHIYSTNNCRVYGRPVRISPMFDVGPDIQFNTQGNMYFGNRGQIVMKDVKKPMAREQFYLMDLGQLGVKGKVVSVQKANGGLLVAVVTPLQ